VIRRWLPVVLVAPLLLGAACASGNKKDAAGSAKTQQIAITLSDAGCEPRSISAKAGPTTFEVKNDNTAKVSEFEILKGRRSSARSRT